jgi:hypothetical protein
MVFSSKQTSALKAKLPHRHVRTRITNGKTIAYLEGWHVIAEANRIFGFENWDRQTSTPRCLWNEVRSGITLCFYTTRVKIVVRAGDTLIIREGIGTGSGRSELADFAHEIALKAAETDATKRALATFGNPFGLALYDKDQAGVTRPKGTKDPVQPPRFVVTSNDGSVREYTNLNLLFKGIEDQVTAISKVPLIYDFWEKNRRLLMRLSALPETAEVASNVVLCLKRRLQHLARENSGDDGSTVPGNSLEADRPSVEAKTGLPHSSTPSNYLLPKEKRLRSKQHLEFIRTKPCLICGRAPVHAHHLRFAQPRAMGMKVSDEYTVPVCGIHHDELHRTGDERAWWARHGIVDPLKIAARLWGESRGINQPDRANGSRAVDDGQSTTA